jgi:hypothetical protein
MSDNPHTFNEANEKYLDAPFPQELARANGNGEGSPGDTEELETDVE